MVQICTLYRAKGPLKRLLTTVNARSLIICHTHAPIQTDPIWTTAVHDICMSPWVHLMGCSHNWGAPLTLYLQVTLAGPHLGT